MNSGVARFERPSTPLEMKALLGKARKTLWWALALALGVHISLTRIAGSEAEQKAAKPLTTQFVKRQPRLTKPLELKKRPQPRRRQVQREMVAVRARMQGTERIAGFQPTQVLKGLARPGVDVGRVLAPQTAGLEPQSVAAAIEGSREVQQKIDMSLELLDVSTMDTGRYHAMVVQDPQDKRSIKGFCHLAIVPPVSVEREALWASQNLSFEQYIAPGFPRIVAAMNQYTSIKTDLLGRIQLDDAEIFRAPWFLFEQREQFRLSEPALQNLGEYLLSGGFAFADGYPLWEAGLIAMLNALQDALRAYGVVGAVEKLPNGHPIFHCYFDFDGPPPGGDASAHSEHPQTCKVYPYVEGMEAAGRLVALYSKKHYACAWAQFGKGGAQAWDPTRPLQFAVNTIVFALTQEGSITHRLMESVK